MGHAGPSSRDTGPAGGVDDPAADVDDFISFWKELNRQAKAHNFSAAIWVARASRLASRQQTGGPDHKPFSEKTLYDRVRNGRRVDWGEACYFVGAVPGMDVQRWRAAWERAERCWSDTHRTPAAPTDSSEPAPALAERPVERPDAQPGTTPAKQVVKWPIVVGGVCVLALGGGVVLGRSAVDTSARPSTSAAVAASSPPGPSTPPPTTSTTTPTQSTSRQHGSPLVVCANSVTVRRDPTSLTDTDVVAELRRGDTFDIERTDGPLWSYGQSDGSRKVSGWVLTKWLKRSC